MQFAQVKELIHKRKDAIVSDLIEFCTIPGINPRMGGTGEAARIAWLQQRLDQIGIVYQIYEVPDSAVPQGNRSNLVVRIPGTAQTAKTLWFIAHVDTVDAGDLQAWNTDPFVPTIKDGRVYGLGVEDNGQAVISALHTCMFMKENGLQAACNIGFIFASDEETGSEYGLVALKEMDGLFSPEDEAMVPDYGCSDGSVVEVAEKSVLWLGVTVAGKQAHASMPHLGINAASIGARLLVELEDMLKDTFAGSDPLFDPPYSTFEPTQRFSNVASTNVMPGKDIFHFDMRVLPNFSLDEILQSVAKLASKYESRYKVRVDCKVLHRADAPPATSPESAVAKTLISILKESGVKASCYGIGGGTCGAILREKGIPALVWSTLDELAHQPNEYTIIDNLVQDTSVFIAMVYRYGN